MRKKKFYTLGLIVLVLVLFFSLVRNVLVLKSANSKIAASKEDLEKIKRENLELVEKARYIQSEEFLEKQLRDKLGLGKIGETVVVLPDRETLKKLSPSWDEEEPLVLPDPNWKKWLKLFL